MKRLITALVACAALAFAQSAAAELKIAVVDVNEAVGQTAEAKAFLARVQGELKVDQDRIRELTADKSRIEEKVERDGEVMSDQERIKLSEEYDRVTSDLKYRVESYQKALNRRRNELFQTMGPRVQAALNDIVELESFDFVVPSNAVIYVNPKHDITRKLAERLDQKAGG
ncbi:MAG TPA: OmpH family outer membrane protein [Pseudomonadales bacterium]|nr:OmpH family outer membrane protein [Pseudomonadales bacterium]